MEKEPRKATEVILALESKIDNLLQIIRSQDLNIKLLSNKLNAIIEKLEKQEQPTPKIIVEAVSSQSNISLPSEDPNKNIPVSSDFNIDVDSSPQGFRRTSRPETFAGDNAYLHHDDTGNRFPMQIPQMQPNKAEVIFNPPSKEDIKATDYKKKASKKEAGGEIPVVQRVVDKNGKSIFLAEVEILNPNSGDSIFKTRTNGTGKWMASLPIGIYRVMIRKRDSSSKDKIESGQDIEVTGDSSPLELQTLIMR